MLFSIGNWGVLWRQASFGAATTLGTQRNSHLHPPYTHTHILVHTHAPTRPNTHHLLSSTFCLLYTTTTTNLFTTQGNRTGISALITRTGTGGDHCSLALETKRPLAHGVLWRISNNHDSSGHNQDKITGSINNTQTSNSATPMLSDIPHSISLYYTICVLFAATKPQTRWTKTKERQNVPILPCL